MKKKTVSAFLSAAVTAGIFAYTPTMVQAANDYAVIVEDKNISFAPQPFDLNGRLMVPLRPLSEALGADVSYDGATDTATVKKDGITLVLNFKTGTVAKNGETLTVDPAPQIVNGRTVVPLRFISEAFGNKVVWSPSANTVTVFPTESTLKKRQKIKDILLKSNGATIAKDSYQLAMTLTEELSSPSLNVKLQGNLVMDYNKNPLAMHGRGSLHVPLATETLPFEVYLTDGQLYAYDANSGQWTKQTVMPKKEWDQFAQLITTPNSEMQAEQISAVLPYYSLQETEDSYLITASLDAAGVKKLIESSEPQLPAELLAADQQALSAFRQMKYTVAIDKTSFLQTRMDMEFEMDIPNGGVIKATVNGNVQNYNNVPVIKVPQDVLDNAVEIPAPAPAPAR